jgi:hypothetical protein
VNLTIVRRGTTSPPIASERIFAPARFRFTDQTLDLSGEAPGVPHGWYRASTGEWYGLVSFTTVSAGATRTPGLLDHQLVPAEAQGWRTNAEGSGPVVPVRRKVVLDLAFALALGGGTAWPISRCYAPSPAANGEFRS